MYMCGLLQCGFITFYKMSDFHDCLRDEDETFGNQKYENAYQSLKDSAEEDITWGIDAVGTGQVRRDFQNLQSLTELCSAQKI